MSRSGESRIKVLLASAEVAPFAKAGGLADVAGALPKALNALGVDVRIIMPSYRMIRENPTFAVTEPIARFPVAIRPGFTTVVEIRETRIEAREGVHGEIPVYLVGESREGSQREAYFEHAVDSGSIYAMEPDPYVFFGRAVVEWIGRTVGSWRPDVIHSNDWHSGLIPLLTKQASEKIPDLKSIIHLFTIHNLAYQGEFTRDQWYSTGLSDDLYTIDGLECYGNWSFMKGALNFADYTNTVSPTYASEILTPEFGNGLDGLLHKIDLHGRLSGILNGIDTQVFNPETDSQILSHYGANNSSGKSDCKAALQKELSSVPRSRAVLIGMGITTSSEQKGLDLFHGEAERLLKDRVQFAMLGMGDPRFERFLLDLSSQHPSKVAVRIEYNAPLAQRIYAGSDLFLMPSRFEPCGLGQLIALRYGTLPIVRNTGGLADTVKDYTACPSSGNGFVFAEYTGEALDNAIHRAVSTLHDDGQREALVKRAMVQDWSWAKSARKYVSLFMRALCLPSMA